VPATVAIVDEAGADGKSPGAEATIHVGEDGYDVAMYRID